jgi:hypothetical protein
MQSLTPDDTRAVTLGHILAGRIVVQGTLTLGPDAGTIVSNAISPEQFVDLVVEMRADRRAKLERIAESVAAAVADTVARPLAAMRPEAFQTFIEDLVVAFALRLAVPDLVDRIPFRDTGIVLMEHEGRVVGALPDHLAARIGFDGSRAVRAALHEPGRGTDPDPTLN